MSTIDYQDSGLGETQEGKLMTAGLVRLVLNLTIVHVVSTLCGCQLRHVTSRVPTAR